MTTTSDSSDLIRSIFFLVLYRFCIFVWSFSRNTRINVVNSFFVQRGGELQQLGYWNNSRMTKSWSDIVTKNLLQILTNCAISHMKKKILYTEPKKKHTEQAGWKFFIQKLEHTIYIYIYLKSTDFENVLNILGSVQMTGYGIVRLQHTHFIWFNLINKKMSTVILIYHEFLVIWRNTSFLNFHHLPTTIYSSIYTLFCTFATPSLHHACTLPTPSTLSLHPLHPPYTPLHPAYTLPTPLYTLH